MSTPGSDDTESLKNRLRLAEESREVAENKARQDRAARRAAEIQASQDRAARQAAEIKASQDNEHARQLAAQLDTIHRVNLPDYPINQDWKFGQYVLSVRQRSGQEYTRHTEHNPASDLLRRAYSLARFAIILQPYVEINSIYDVAAKGPRFPLPLRITAEECRQKLERIPFQMMSSLLDQFASADGSTLFVESVLELIRNPPSNLTNTEVAENIGWIAIIRHLMLFKHMIAFKPEEQFRCQLWAPILSHFIRSSIFVANPEFKLNYIPGYSKSFYADWCMIFREPPTSEVVPILIAEFAAAKVKKDETHKDFQKLACAMWASALYYIGLLRNFPECRDQVRIQGILFSGTQAQLCVLAPKFEPTSSPSSASTSSALPKSAINFVFQTSKNWIFDLADENLQTCTDNAECCDTIQESNLRFDIDDQLLSRIALNSNVEFQVDESRLNERNESGSGSESAFAGYHNVAIADGLMSGLVSIEKFMDCAQHYGIHLSECLKKHKSGLREPFMINERISDIIMTTRRSHASSSPDKKVATPKKTKSEELPPSRNAIGKRKASGHSYESDDTSRNRCTNIAKDIFEDEQEIVETIVETDRLVVLKCKVVGKSIDLCLKYKNVITDELEIMHKLADCKHVVTLHHGEIIDCSMFFCEEWLVPVEHILQTFKDAEPAQYIPQAIEYYLDGMNALLELNRHHVVHCDISPNNFMFSPRDYRWKLIDFEHARRLISDGSEDTGFVVTHSGLVGTRDFIAPESMTANADGRHEYSFASDLYSMARTTFELMLSPFYDITSMYLSSDTPEIGILLDVYDLAFRQTRPDPATRIPVKTGLKRALETVPLIAKTFSAHHGYYPLTNYM